jgi:ATP-dependent helicase HrpB
VRRDRAAVVVAPPGAGKTTRVPPALLADGPLILLQPRRLAARALARRIASEQGWTVGGEIGWQVRFDRQLSARTRLLVATEGILTARLQSDPLLADFRTVVLDEFHERSLHADLALALVRQAMAARDDLRVVVMSATLDARAVAAYLGGCAVIEAAGYPHPVEISYAPGVSPADAVRAALRRPGGHILCFLPGAGEIRRAEEELRGCDAAVFPLHGSLDAEAQDEALAPSAGRKVILATNLAETSLTVDGVTDVIDVGLQKVLRHDPGTGIDRLQTERIAADSATQRAGRAGRTGRTGPGRAVRLWDARDQLREHREAEIARADLAAPFLEVFAWGGDPRRFDWFEPPPAERAAAAIALLEDLGAVRAGKIADLGRSLQRFPLHPRLARLLVETRGSPAGAAACAILSEGWTERVGREASRPDASGRRAPSAPTTSSDLLQRVDQMRAAPPHVRRVAEELGALARRVMGGGAAPAADAGQTASAGRSGDDESFRRATFAAYPDRVARRRAPGSPRLVLASGGGAVLAAESGVHDGDFMVAIDVAAGARGPGSEALVRMAGLIERDWIEPTRRAVEQQLDEKSGTVRAVERSYYRELVLSENPVAPDPAISGALLAEVILRGDPSPEDEQLLRRLRFAGLPADRAELVRRACEGQTALARVDLSHALPTTATRDLDRLAPESIPLPSGRRARLEYRDDGGIVASVKLQELFGLADTPRLGPKREPVTFALLSPAGRPVQTTRDLRSFWEKTYPEVRKELRGRYPRHPWPDDPWTATPTHRTTRRTTRRRT